jgi:hypothetical protein
VTLPTDLSASLKYLDDAQLLRLIQAVTVEINRRNSRRFQEVGCRGPWRRHKPSGRRDGVGLNNIAIEETADYEDWRQAAACHSRRDA